MTADAYREAFDVFDADFRHSWCADRKHADLSSGTVACGCGIVSSDPCPCHWDPTITALCAAEGIDRGEGLSDGQAALLRRRFAEAIRSPWGPPVGTLLDKDAITALLRECVTVVAPGETLVIRAPDYFTPNHLREVQDIFNACFEDGFVTFQAWIVPGAELCKVTASELEDAVQRTVWLAMAAASLEIANDLVLEGKISVNDVRRARGLPEWIPGL